MNENSNEGDSEKSPSDFLDPVLRQLESQASAEKKDFYTDPSTGYLVMTSFYLKNRGYCCENNCRHCPY